MVERRFALRACDAREACGPPQLGNTVGVEPQAMVAATPPAVLRAESQRDPALDAEARRAVTLLMPLLRLADSLDRSNRQPVKSLECDEQPDRFVVKLTVLPEAESDLEEWAAEQLAPLFRTVYGKPLEVVRGS